MFDFAQYPNLSNRRILFIGDGSGIGAALTAAFARQDARTRFIHINDESSRALADRLDRGCPKHPVDCRHCDIRDVAALQPTMANLGESNKRVNIMIPGAILTGRQPDPWITPGDEAPSQPGRHPKQRLLSEHVAPTELFLGAYDSARCIAREYFIDGGWC